MNSFVAVVVATLVYFAVLYFFAWYSQKKQNATDQPLDSSNVKWWAVAISLVGTSISGVTFISVPGLVSSPSMMTYFQFVLGNTIGFFVIVYVLLPMYYRRHLDSIYEWMGNRFGKRTHQTAAWFFIISRLIGSSVRLYLGCLVLYVIGFEKLGIPFSVIVVVFSVFMWIYTRKGGIKNIIWTDFFQTVILVGVAVVTFIYFFVSLPQGTEHLLSSSQNKIFILDNFWGQKNHLFKQLLAGIFVTIVMSGLDQDTMQKNLKLKSLQTAQKNYVSFAIAFLITNFFFLLLGLLFFEFMQANNIPTPTKTDTIFAMLTQEYMGWVGVSLFVVGVIAATFSSCASSLLSLSTAFIVDIKGIKPALHPQQFAKMMNRSRLYVILGFVLILFIFSWINEESVVMAIFKIASYTYGPLLGIFAFGFLSQKKVMDEWTPYIALLAVIATVLIDRYSAQLFGGYSFGFEILLVNGGLAVLGLSVGAFFRSKQSM